MTAMPPDPLPEPTRGRRCKSRHRKCWVIRGGILWCYECGAIRPNSDPGADRWIYPVGPDGENPAMARYRAEHPVHA